MEYRQRRAHPRAARPRRAYAAEFRLDAVLLHVLRRRPTPGHRRPHRTRQDLAGGQRPRNRLRRCTGALHLGRRAAHPLHRRRPGACLLTGRNPTSHRRRRPDRHRRRYATPVPRGGLQLVPPRARPRIHRRSGHHQSLAISAAKRMALRHRRRLQRHRHVLRHHAPRHDPSGQRADARPRRRLQRRPDVTLRRRPQQDRRAGTPAPRAGGCARQAWRDGAACPMRPFFLCGVLLCVAVTCAPAQTDSMPRVVVAKDKRSFALEPGGRKFIPWGFNYDHDVHGRLLEDYWESEWDKVERHFAQMKKLGANVVRIHLQLAKFMEEPDRPNAKALARLGDLLGLAERTGLYLDVTGLGCYHKKDVPAWYDKLSEADRWEVQARFWEGVAKRCAASPAVFCYDLMNEPVVPGGKRKDGDWLGPPFGGKHFVQFITLDQDKRPRPDVARRWTARLARAIRAHDKRHLITVGLVDWSLDKLGLTSGFVPAKIADDLDFLSVHIYPKGGKVDEALETLASFDVGKPIVIEETFPLRCSVEELGRFIEGSKKHAVGWIGFYWGKTPDELRRSGTIGDAITLSWLEYFQKMARERRP